MLTAVNLLTFVVSLLLEAAIGAVDVVPLLIWMLVTELTGFFFLAFGALCAMATGWLLAVPVIYVGLNFVVMAYYYILEGVGARIWVNRSSYSSVSTLCGNLIAWLTPAMKISDELRTPGDFGIEPYQKGATLFTMNPGALPTVLVYTLVGVLMLVLACALYRARHSESAGDAIVFPWLRPVVKYVISIAAGLSLGTIVHEAVFGYENTSVINLILCMIIMGGLIYCALEMLLRKSFKIFDKRTLLGLAALWVAFGAICACISLDIFGYEKWVPDPEKVEKVHLNMGCEVNSDDPDVIRAVTELHRVLTQRGTNKTRGYEFSVEYWMKNGDIGMRWLKLKNLDLNDPEIYQAVSNLLSQPGVHFTRLLSDRGAYGENFVGGYAHNPMTGKEVRLTPEQCLALYRAMEADEGAPLKPEDLLKDEDTGLFLELDTGFGSYLVDGIQTGNVNTMALLEEYGLMDPAE